MSIQRSALGGFRRIKWVGMIRAPYVNFSKVTKVYNNSFSVVRYLAALSIG